MDLVCDRFHQVRFSKSARTVEKKRIVGRRMIGDGDRSGMGKLIGAADDEVFKGIILFGNKRGSGALIRRVAIRKSGSGRRILWLRIFALRLFKRKGGFGKNPYMDAKIERALKDSFDFRRVFLIQQIDEAVACSRDECFFIVEIDKLEVIEPKLHDRICIFF